MFTDVDLANTTSIEYFSSNGGSLGKFFAPTANNGLSFLGVQFTDGELISKIQITTGNTVLGPNDGGSVDVVVMDDFIYSEPRAARSRNRLRGCYWAPAWRPCGGESGVWHLMSSPLSFKKCTKGSRQRLPFLLLRAGRDLFLSLAVLDIALNEPPPGDFSVAPAVVGVRPHVGWRA